MTSLCAPPPPLAPSLSPLPPSASASPARGGSALSPPSSEATAPPSTGLIAGLAVAGCVALVVLCDGHRRQVHGVVLCVCAWMVYSAARGRAAWRRLTAKLRDGAGHSAGYATPPPALVVVNPLVAIY